MKRVIVFTAVDDVTIKFRQYEIPKISEPEVLKASLEMKEIGPHFDLKLRRSQVGSHDLFKLACKKPKLVNIEKKKVSRTFFIFRPRRTCIRLRLATKKRRCSFSSKILEFWLQESSR